MAVRVARIEDVPVHGSPVEGLSWRPVRHHLGVRAFGVNAYTGAAEGDLVIEPHDEDAHEELYVVLAGLARFSVDGEAVEAPAGTLVLVTPPSHRVAHAGAPATTVLVVGGTPGEAFAVSEWETSWRGEGAG